MSETIIDHGYIPEEHAPDPVIGHGDPIAPGKLGIWLFLASEIMFFIGLLGTYIVLRSGSPHMFQFQGQTLNKTLAGINTLVLIFSSLTMALAVDAAQKANRGRLIAFLGLTVLMAFGFIGIKVIEYKDKLTHYTILAKEGTGANAKVYIYDGHREALDVGLDKGKLAFPKGTKQLDHGWCRGRRACSSGVPPHLICADSRHELGGAPHCLRPRAQTMLLAWI